MFEEYAYDILLSARFVYIFNFTFLFCMCNFNWFFNVRLLSYCKFRIKQKCFCMIQKCYVSHLSICQLFIYWNAYSLSWCAIFLKKKTLFKKKKFSCVHLWYYFVSWFLKTHSIFWPKQWATICILYCMLRWEKSLLKLLYVPKNCSCLIILTDVLLYFLKDYDSSSLFFK